MKAAILGTSGYAGLVLLRLLAEHPEITDIIAVSASHCGVSVHDVDPGAGLNLRRKTGITGEKLASLERAAELEPDVVFAALPHLKSAELCEPFLGNSVVIDLSADFRLRNPAEFERAYGSPPPRPDLLEDAVYGLTEWERASLRGARLVANPGCYPTCAALPLLPLLRENLIEPDVRITALSGISGAGRAAKQNMLFVERTENMNAYNPGTRHRHVEEMRQSLARYGNAPELEIFFVPHLVPVRQGMLCTTCVRLAPGVGSAEIDRALERAYGEEPFVRFVGERIPESRHVRGSNRCDIGRHVEGRNAVLFSSIDNLFKGAGGQAVQNMNACFGWNETAGLATGGEF